VECHEEKSRFPIETRTQDLPTTRQECYRLSQLNTCRVQPRPETIGGRTEDICCKIAVKFIFECFEFGSKLIRQPVVLFIHRSHNVAAQIIHEN
jgi:hypothetical protein